MCLCGCSNTTLTMGTTKLSSTSFLQRRTIAKVAIGTNGFATMEGYRGSGDSEMMKAIMEGSAAIAGQAAEGAVKGAK